MNRTYPMLVRHSAVPIVIATSLLLLAGCSGSSGSTATSGSSGSLTVAIPAAPDTLDPALTQSRYASAILPNYCEKLYDITPNQEIVPMLATALPTTSADGKTYTINLRSGVTFNDGTTF